MSDNADMSVSVIMPAYNSAAFIGEALDSVVSQTRAVTEIIVIDDGSTDETCKIASSYPNVVVVRTNHQGPAAARNTGIRRAQGKYVAFLDADDIWYADKIRDHTNALATHPNAAFCFATLWGLPYPNQTNQLIKPYWPDELVAWLDGKAVDDGSVFGDVYGLLLRANCVNTSSVVVRREALIEVGMFDESMNHGEDHDLWLRLARRWPAVFMVNSKSRYRIHAASSSGAPDARQDLFYRSTVEVLTKHGHDFPSFAVSRALGATYKNYAIFHVKAGRRIEARRLAGKSLLMAPTFAGFKIWVEAVFPRFYSLATGIARGTRPV